MTLSIALGPAFGLVRSTPTLMLITPASRITIVPHYASTDLYVRPSSRPDTLPISENMSVRTSFIRYTVSILYVAISICHRLVLLPVVLLLTCHPYS
ncbi:hypothetical protein BJ138DRAFT_1149764 [Hygrophoropsis aurantiaca]|uniref:Uncharacterized protein n=1 Tax=Hygrophoropsis aurantiaca TaxID=72124 RepID=A0ACB8AGW3_9AGAM|nr:hypothetical protein BJ138DRAFT_1149764 [Hygrophoropsis aurantiaca]